MRGNHFNTKIVTGAASKAVAVRNLSNQQNQSNLKKEVFEHKDCITISTYESLYVLETCQSIIEAVLDHINKSEEDQDGVVMLSSVIATFIYSHDFNNSKILKKRMQLLMNNKLVKTTPIKENDPFTGYGLLNLKNDIPDMTQDTLVYEDFQKKFYDPTFQKKVLSNLQIVLSNETLLLQQKMKQLKIKVNFDFSKTMNKYFHGLTNEFIKIYDIIPQFAIVLEDDTSESYHLLTGLETMSNVLKTVKTVYKDDILKFIEADIMEFRSTFYSIHQLYGALLAQKRMITVLVNMTKQFLQTNMNYIKDGEFIINEEPALSNILHSLMQIDTKILNPSINTCSEFCVENSMLVNQNHSVIINLKQKYNDNLTKIFDSLTELLGDMIDVLMVNFDENPAKIEIEPHKDYFKYLGTKALKPQATNSNLKYAFIPPKTNSLDSSRRHQLYSNMTDAEILNSKIAKSAGALSHLTLTSSSSAASSQTASPINSKNNSRQNSLSNKNKAVRKRGSSVSSNASTVKGRSRSSSVNSVFKNNVILTPSKKLEKSTVAMSRSSTNDSTRNLQKEISAESYKANNTSTTSLDEEIHDDGKEEEFKKVRFGGVPKYPMVYESIKPTRQGWYSKPAVLHYPLIPDYYASNIDSITTSPVSKQRQMEGFAFKHINSLFKKVRE